MAHEANMGENLQKTYIFYPYISLLRLCDKIFNFFYSAICILQNTRNLSEQGKLPVFLSFLRGKILKIQRVHVTE